MRTYSYAHAIHDISELGMSELVDTLACKDREHLLRLVLEFLTHESAAPESVFHKRLRMEFFRMGFPISDSVRLGNWVIRKMHQIEEQFGHLLQANYSIEDIQIRDGLARITAVLVEETS